MSLGKSSFLSSDSSAVLSALHRSLAIIEFDVDGNILDANQNFCSAVGYDRSEIVGQHHRIFVNPQEAATKEYQDFWLRLKGGEYDAGEYCRYRKDGSEIWIQATYNPVLGRSGRAYKVIKFASDITGAKFKSAEDAGKIEAISRAQAVIEFDPAGNILTANENFCGAVGYGLEEIVGRHHRMFVDPEYARSTEYQQFWQRLADGELISEEFKRFGKGGKEIWIQASYNPIFDMNGKVMKVVKFATDITGRVCAVNEIGSGLNALAEGDLQLRIDTPFIPSLERLRTDFNHSVEKLESALSQVGSNAVAIKGGASEIKAASDELSKRTEQQAASVEETAAAVEEITSTVKTTAERAQEVGKLADTTQAEAEKSGVVVDNAVSAMDDIKKSSDQIANIIGVIDDIAFQTNLLALNAGVEAARAGEAGKGFAVVAQEVRELAQRSASAAKEIKELITTSGSQVQSGVDLVAETGQALKSIVGSIAEVTDHVSAIVQASHEQSNGLQEINQAVNTIDQGTQQNATMVEEATAASHTLEAESAALNGLLQQFKLGSVRSEQRAVAQPATAHTAKAALARGHAFHGNAAVDEDNWDEF
ncbi:methyl-accepting chemotaxis protein [Hoeflea poritis]|uniref:Methyl-accepting chemotaxis protein n=1 Tax=Hoeflea poritis TaxID=2993659 RepID=A0ABT4VVM1_9HYPH|nr:methyl-accepting chemotaxis protein [Hoeflea poritis]MDA4848746.1 methyl-accepting chemotaxis protein [Hoeflea poritis]